ncbi:uncharacterized protein LOC135809464 [Sycon ciliatum]|uniref:uncharacterized protein LOC135809464 n=1 Tax=Sycon ciliatum TaxID=27933 RepID=UPI0020AAFFBB|eukprot:scpid89371/ scgid15698/ 
MSSWIVRRWAKTARPIIIRADKPKGFKHNRRALKAGEVRRDPQSSSALWYIVTGCIPPVSYLFYVWYAPRYKLAMWARHHAYEEVLKEDREWEERRKEYGLDRFPRQIWHDKLDKLGGVDFPEATYDPPWPGTGGEPTKDESLIEWYVNAAKCYLNLGK